MNITPADEMWSRVFDQGLFDPDGFRSPQKHKMLAEKERHTHEERLAYDTYPPFRMEAMGRQALDDLKYFQEHPNAWFRARPRAAGEGGMVRPVCNLVVVRPSKFYGNAFSVTPDDIDEPGWELFLPDRPHPFGRLLLDTPRTRKQKERERALMEQEQQKTETYREENGSIIWNKPISGGVVAVPLTNFTARIVADITENDGAEVRRVFQIEACVRGRAQRFTIPAERFASMSWPAEFLGAGAIVFPGMGIRDHARAAIQILSKGIAERTVFTHTGWLNRDGGFVYLHAGGAIGKDGPVPNVEVQLSGALNRYALILATNIDEERAAIRASLGILEVAPDRITMPLLGATFRAVLGTADFSVFLVGPTGTGKTQVSALAQQHFGASMDAQHLPGSWSSTGNALEAIAFGAKDALFTIDDFAPNGSTSDIQRMQRDADRVLRGQGNNSGRQRMNANGTLRPTKPPRGLILSTGEDIPKGQSLRARSLVLELGPQDVNWKLLTLSQRDADKGRYSIALAGFVRYLAERYEEHQLWLKDEVLRLRDKAVDSVAHKRTPGIIANLGAGFHCFLNYAVEAGAITVDEAKGLWKRCWKALGDAAKAQAVHQSASEPATRFLELLRAALTSGKAHLAALDGGKPESAEALGWREVTTGTGGYEHSEWRPQGMQVGWMDGQNVYLNRDAAAVAAQSIGREIGDSVTISTQVLSKRLYERGYLASIDETRETLLIRRTIQGKQLNVLHLSLEVLFPPGEPDNSDSE